MTQWSSITEAQYNHNAINKACLHIFSVFNSMCSDFLSRALWNSSTDILDFFSLRSIGLKKLFCHGRLIQKTKLLKMCIDQSIMAFDIVVLFPFEPFFKNRHSKQSITANMFRALNFTSDSEVVL